MKRPSACVICSVFLLAGALLAQKPDNAASREDVRNASGRRASTMLFDIGYLDAITPVLAMPESERACRNQSRMMITDAQPRSANRAGFLESDRIRTLDLPQNGRLLTIAKSIESVGSADARRACTEFLAEASEFYATPLCGVRVLAARPLRVRENWATELFGDYNPETMLIRLWMRTAVRKEITSFGTFLSTLCHEFCHHLDYQQFGFPDSWHTRGFHERTAALYHHARGTPQKRLIWVSVSGGRWRIDWPRTNRGA